MAKKAKTVPTSESVTLYLDALEESRRTDCQHLITLLQRLTGCSPTMWGPSIVGFGSYHYKYDSGHEGDICRVGFSSRKSDISIYLLPSLEGADELLAQLGKHKMGKSCLSIKRLSDIQLPVLEKLVNLSLAETQKRYPA